jgi:hypothetical protein
MPHVNVDRRLLPPWVSERLSDAQLTLPPRHRWLRVLTAPDVPLSGTDTLTALALGVRMNTDGYVQLGYDELASTAKLTRRTVVDAVARLEVAGWLGVQRGGGRAHVNAYWGAYPQCAPGVDNPGATVHELHPLQGKGAPPAPP